MTENHPLAFPFKLLGTLTLVMTLLALGLLAVTLWRQRRIAAQVERTRAGLDEMVQAMSRGACGYCGTVGEVQEHPDPEQPPLPITNLGGLYFSWVLMAYVHPQCVLDAATGTRRFPVHDDPLSHYSEVKPVFAEFNARLNLGHGVQH